MQLLFEEFKIILVKDSQIVRKSPDGMNLVEASLRVWCLKTRVASSDAARVLIFWSSFSSDEISSKAAQWPMISSPVLISISCSIFELSLSFLFSYSTKSCFKQFLVSLSWSNDSILQSLSSMPRDLISPLFLIRFWNPFKLIRTESFPR